VNHLLRSYAPITDAAWSQIDDEARTRLVPALAAASSSTSRPEGWEYAATTLGRVTAIAEVPAEGLVAHQRRVLPLVSCAHRSAWRAPSSPTRTVGRSTSTSPASMRRRPPSPVRRTWPCSTDGPPPVSPASPRPARHTPCARSEYAGYPARVARAVETLLEAGIAGPYGLALGPDGYTGVVETTEHGGLVVFDHLRQILGGPIVWAPGGHGGRGGVTARRRFRLRIGRDLSVGYHHHDAHSVHFYLEESFSFHAASPDAAVALTAVNTAGMTRAWRGEQPADPCRPPTRTSRRGRRRRRGVLSRE